eukprot:TRINITY_DN5680_c0_g1_i1.p1 TRINITY_DN5680_c0_g1~~TRINITY_DN5680_c0_g1_i1.p1  ORF type:complete len:207 (-),score=57.89 TRINITY_DN5680_c0_g1_i1:244-864(-)
MIKAIIVFNNFGKARLIKFYDYYPVERQQHAIREVYQLVSRRDESLCNFLEGGPIISDEDIKLIYRQYATLYFVVCADCSESELGILDMIQVLVETLDKCFESVCELDFIFHMDKVHFVLDEVIMGGLVLETNQADVMAELDEQTKVRKSENTTSGLVKDTLSSAPNRAVTAAKNLKNTEISTLPQKLIPSLPKSFSLKGLKGTSS